jgi:hypothetical protein
MKRFFDSIKFIWRNREAIRSYLKELKEAMPVAIGRVEAGFEWFESKYPGTVKMQIAYNETRTELMRRGMLNDDITGAVIYIALGLSYLFIKTDQKS